MRFVHFFSQSFYRSLLGYTHIIVLIFEESDSISQGALAVTVGGVSAFEGLLSSSIPMKIKEFSKGFMGAPGSQKRPISIEPLHQKQMGRKLGLVDQGLACSCRKSLWPLILAYVG